MLGSLLGPLELLRVTPVRLADDELGALGHDAMPARVARQVGSGAQPEDVLRVDARERGAAGELPVDRYGDVVVEAAGLQPRDERALQVGDIAALQRRVDEDQPTVDGRVLGGHMRDTVVRGFAMRGGCGHCHVLPDGG